MHDIPLTQVKITGGFLHAYYRLASDVMIPYQWDVFNGQVEGDEKSYCLDNLYIAAGLSEGTFKGMLFQDSDLAKWLEALAYCLTNGDNQALEEKADGLIALIAKAQQSDGYLNTYFQVNAPERRLTNLYEAHELYCLGHLMEAAVAYDEATGKRLLRDIVTRYADLVVSRFGTGDGQVRGCPGHQEIELALVKLYEWTREEKYLTLSRYFLDERGSSPQYFQEEWEKRGGFSEWTKRIENPPADFSYNQAHLPVREQTEAVGHAVRAMYMYTAMAEVGRLTGDADLLHACRVLFDNVRRQTYVTGGIGATNHGEAFTFAHDLPNDINYSETCASIGLIFFLRSMLKVEVKSIYADEMERALYNTVLASLQTDGKRYFYVNPMEALPEASDKNPTRRHVKTQRQHWHNCACCPPNVARLLASLGKYLYSANDGTVYVHLYATSILNTEINSVKVTLRTETQYPNDGQVQIRVESVQPSEFTMALRIPGWCAIAEVYVNGESITPEHKDGYAYITRMFIYGDQVEARFEMTPRLVYAHTHIRADNGLICVQRGPIIYCLEECDNGANLHALLLDGKTMFDVQTEVIGGMECFRIKAEGVCETSLYETPYSFAPPERVPITLTFVPYYLWGNRSKGEMIVWVRAIVN